jgi:hypothetical protein
VGIYVLYFTLSEPLVKESFARWSPPKRVTRKVVNPFTQQAVTMRLLVPRDGLAGSANVPQRAPQFDEKFLLPQMLGPLLGGAAEGWPRLGAELLSGDGSPQGRDGKALVEPMLMGSEDETLHRLPALLVGALANLDTAHAKPLGSAWSKLLRRAETPYAPSPADAARVLLELGRLGRAATSRRQDVYACTR